MRSIAVFLPNWIGDVVMATPAIRALREHFPAHRLIAVCKPYVSEVLNGSPWFDDIVLFDRKGPSESRFWNAIARLKSHEPESAVLFPNSFRSALLARLAGCQRVFGFARYFRDMLLTKRVYPTRDRFGRYQPTPMILDYNRVVKLLDVPDPGCRMELFTTPDDELAANEAWRKLGLTRFHKVIGLNPGGAFGAAKHWPVEYFAEFARLLVDQTGSGVVVLCGPAEIAAAERIAGESGRPAVVSLSAVSLSLGLTKAIVRRLALLVTTDSGPRHFAAAFDVPVITLFGPTHIEWTETYFPKAVHLQKQLPCGPCQQRVCPLGHHQCMKDLMPAEVFKTADHLLRMFTERTPLEQRHAS